MNISLRRIRASCLVLGLFVFPVSASALPTFSNLFVFGDSLSDTGNAAIALTSAGITPPFQCVPFVCEGDPNSDLVPGLPYPLAPIPRFTNGPVWVEGLASRLGLSADPALSGGTNFSFGGARTGPLGTTPPDSPSLLDQFFILSGGQAAVDPDALYVVWGGGDDGRDISKAKVDPTDPVSDIEVIALIDEAVSNIATIVGALAAEGVSILVPNLPDLGLIPEARDRDQAGDLEGLVAASSMVSAAFNVALDAVLDSLALAFPSADIIELDVFSLVNDVVSNPPAYGFLDGVNPCVTFDTVCSNPDDLVFLDGVHPTAAAHAVIGRAALAAVPEPAMIMLLALGLSGLGYVRHRRYAHAPRCGRGDHTQARTL